MKEIKKRIFHFLNKSQEKRRALIFPRIWRQVFGKQKLIILGERHSTEVLEKKIFIRLNFVPLPKNNTLMTLVVLFYFTINFTTLKLHLQVINFLTWLLGVPLKWGSIKLSMNHVCLKLVLRVDYVKSELFPCRRKK